MIYGSLSEIYKKEEMVAVGRLKRLPTVFFIRSIVIYLLHHYKPYNIV